MKKNIFQLISIFCLGIFAIPAYAQECKTYKSGSEGVYIDTTMQSENQQKCIACVTKSHESDLNQIKTALISEKNKLQKTLNDSNTTPQDIALLRQSVKSYEQKLYEYNAFINADIKRICRIN